MASVGAASLGSDELIRIQQAIGEAFGHMRFESPATIARELAHEGAELRHPEIIECARAGAKPNGQSVEDIR